MGRAARGNPGKSNAAWPNLFLASLALRFRLPKDAFNDPANARHCRIGAPWVASTAFSVTA